MRYSRRHYASVKQSSDRCWTSRLNLYACTDPTLNLCISTASELITWALVLKSGGRRLSVMHSFIQMTERESKTTLIIPALQDRPTSWSCGCARAMEVTAGF